jgi:hypothetical protein
MTVVIVFAALAAPIAAVVGYLAWRDRRRQPLVADPSVSRDALRQADRARSVIDSAAAAQGHQMLGGQPVVGLLAARRAHRSDNP